MSDLFDRAGFLERLDQLRMKAGLSKGEFSKKIGVEHIFSRYADPKPDSKDRKIKSPSVETLLTISNIFNADVNWLLTGKGESSGYRAGGGLDDGPPIIVSGDPAAEAWLAEHGSPDYRAINLYEDGRLAAGAGGLVFDPYQEAASPVIVYQPELRGRQRHRLAAARVGGDSMHPTVPAGAIVVIDLDDRLPVHRRIYAINRPEEGLPTVAIKRLIKWEKGLLIVSDNQAYLPEDGGSDWNKLVVGRVVWTWRSLEDA